VPLLAARDVPHRRGMKEAVHPAVGCCQILQIFVSSLILLYMSANLLLVSGRVMGFKEKLEEYYAILAWLGLKV